MPKEKEKLMPVKISQHKGGYKVSTPGGTKAKHTSKAKAESQARLLRGIEHGWKPDTVLGRTKNIRSK